MQILLLHIIYRQESPPSRLCFRRMCCNLYHICILQCIICESGERFGRKTIEWAYVYACMCVWGASAVRHEIDCTSSTPCRNAGVRKVTRSWGWYPGVRFACKPERNQIRTNQNSNQSNSNQSNLPAGGVRLEDSLLLLFSHAPTPTTLSWSPDTTPSSSTLVGTEES